MWDREADVIIVGFGGAGAAAALAAVDAGADVLLVEKNPEGGGNTSYSGGSIRTYTDLDKAVDFIEAVCEGTTERQVVSTFVTESSRNQTGWHGWEEIGPRPAIGNQGISNRSSGSCLSIDSGRFLVTVSISDAHPVLVSISRESSPVKTAARRNCEIHHRRSSNDGQAKIKVVGSRAPSRMEDITGADIVISVGRAIRQESQLEGFRQLAAALGGVIAASRPIVDLGWLSSDHQVGLSGLTVKPKVYLAFGISGAAQHLVGMSQSRLIIAINNDASAPIFQVAHCGAIADMFEILPPLLEKAKCRNLKRKP